MSQIAIGQLIWFAIGIAIGALAAWWWLHTKATTRDEAARLLLAPAETVTAQAPKVLITVDWGVINSALAGSGYVAVPKDSFTSH